MAFEEAQRYLSGRVSLSVLHFAYFLALERDKKKDGRGGTGMLGGQLICAAHRAFR